MWIKKVTAHAFGPFRGEELELSPNLTVVVGPNESGKSTWHDAIYAALCGVRSRRGRGTKEENAFARKRRPWDGDEWRVSARLVLPDNRNVEIHHDLADQIQSWAKDLDMGIPITDEITIRNASPDGSVWLGIDRDAFRSVATIRQADILGVTDSAGTLQDYLQRAAASFGADETASRAINIIEDYLREHVGREVANSKRPLKESLDRVREAERHLEKARIDHLEWQEKLEELDEVRTRARSVSDSAAAAEARLALSDLEHLENVLTEARDLAARHPEPPRPSDDEAELREKVAIALQEWRNRPTPAPLSGRGVAELEADLAETPEPPSGDTEVDPEVGAAHRSLGIARERHLAHLAEDPGPIRAMPEDPDDDRSPNPGLALILGAAAVLLLGGAWALANGNTFIGIATLALGLLAGWAAITRSQRVGLHHVVVEQVAAVTARGREIWEEKEAGLAASRADAAVRLMTALEARGLEVGGELDEDGIEELYARYESECRERSRIALDAARRPALIQALADRRRAEDDFRQAQERVEAARAGLIAAVESVGGQVTDEADMVAFLEDWQSTMRHEVASKDLARSEWARFQALLSGRTLKDMEAELERARARAKELAAGVDPGFIAAIDPGDDPETTVRALKQEAEELTRQVVALERELAVRQESYLNVADAEEEYETARRDRERVESMADVLTTASDILQRAQEKVHRDIAPKLREGISDRLAKVTGGRYSEVMVNPETLEVEVKDSSGQWRSADQLSHGTAEQVYLLLRVAMAEILTPAGIRCPLLLDDTTVHADAARTEALLSVIREVSTDHQVVLFSQEESVIRWARAEGVPMVELSQL